MDQFRSERARLEQILDAKVETAEELSLAKYVSSANEEVVKFPQINSAAFNGEVVREADEAQRMLRWIKMKAETAINAGRYIFFPEIGEILNFPGDPRYPVLHYDHIPRFDLNSKQTSLDSLKKDFKSFSNEIFGTLKALLDLGLYCVSQMLKPMEEDLRRKASSSSQSEWYDPEVKNEMVKVSLAHLERVQSIVQRQLADFKGTEEEKIRTYSSPRVATLIGRLMQRADLGDMR